MLKRPYPSGQDGKAMNNAFDAFVQTVQAKETDKGVAMFSRSANSAPNTPLTAIRTAINKAYGKLLSMPSNASSDPVAIPTSLLL